MKHPLSKNFDLYEFVASWTASKLNIDNTPSVEVIKNLSRLCTDLLQPLREELGSPIYVSSGFRCLALNKAVGGVSDSQHLKGLAADIFSPQYRNVEIADVIKSKFEYDQLIVYTTFIHVSIAPIGQLPRMQFLDFRPDNHA